MVHVEQEQISRGELFIDCPRCGAMNVAATCYELRETYQLIIRNTTTWVTCSACGKDLYSRRPAAEIIGRSPGELRGIVTWRVGLVNRFLAIVCILLAILPFIGLITALVAAAINWRHRGWPKVCSQIGLALAVAAAIFFGVIWLRT